MCIFTVNYWQNVFRYYMIAADSYFVLGNSCLSGGGDILQVTSSQHFLGLVKADIFDRPTESIRTLTFVSHFTTIFNSGVNFLIYRQDFSSIRGLRLLICEQLCGELLQKRILQNGRVESEGPRPQDGHAGGVAEDHPSG